MTGPMSRRLVPRIPGGADWGIALALGTALISGLAIYLNGFAVKQVPDAAVYTTLKNGVAAAILVGAVVALRGPRVIFAVPRSSLPATLAVGVIGGSVPFVLFFTGLAQASAPSAAFIQKTLFLWVAVLAVPFLGERLGRATLLGLAGLLAGQALVLSPTGIVWGTGETLILAATALWATETVLVRRLLAAVPTETMATARMGGGLIVLVGYLAVSGKLAGIAMLNTTQWTWIGLTGLILAAYVATWFAALRRAPASVVTSVLVVGAAVTGALTAASKGAVPTAPVAVGYLLIVAAVALIIVATRLAARSVANAAPGLPRSARVIVDDD
jgi:drug/metabolite transporter (DMT)-like permease